VKTQREFWTWLEIDAQLATYAHGEAMWDAEAGVWVDMPVVSQDVAAVLHMPRVEGDEEPRVDIHQRDLAAGWETARLAYRIVLDRADAKNKSGRGTRLWPAAPITDVERYAARFQTVESHRDGSALVRECQALGIWGPELEATARLALIRITS
jgi:hypothetical protein